jgi:hypothetical protein
LHSHTQTLKERRETEQLGIKIEPRGWAERFNKKIYSQEMQQFVFHKYWSKTKFRNFRQEQTFSNMVSNRIKETFGPNIVVISSNSAKGNVGIGKGKRK